MKHSGLLLAISLFFIIPFALVGQNPDLNIKKDSAFVNKEISTFAINMDYDTRYLYAGRDYGQKKSALYPNLTYFHKSGLYGALTSLFFSDSAFYYSQTSFRLGYLGKFTKSWRYGASYNHTWFSPANQGLLSNSLSLSTSIDFGPWVAGTSLTGYFGQESGKQVNLYFGGSWDKDFTGWIDNVSISPTISMLSGTENVAFNRVPLKWFQTSAGKTWSQRRLNRGGGGKIPTQQKTVFGVLSLTISAPVYITKGAFTFGVTPSYIIPHALKGEENTNTLHNAFFINFSAFVTL
jgi:hypothetical protein